MRSEMARGYRIALVVVLAIGISDSVVLSLEKSDSVLLSPPNNVTTYTARPIVRALAGVLYLLPMLTAQLVSAGIPESGVIHRNTVADFCQQGSHRLTDPCTGDSILLQSSTISLDLFVCEVATILGPDVGIECPVIEVQGVSFVALDCVPELRNVRAEVTDSGTVLSWSEMLCVDTYDVIRGNLPLVSEELAAVVCIVNDTTDKSTENNPDGEVPGTGEAFFYVVRPTGRLGFDHYGLNSAGLERAPSSGDCPL